MKVVIDARIEPGLAGGVATAVQSLIQGLGALTDGDEEYVIIADGEKQRAWLAPLLSGNQRLAIWPRTTPTAWQRFVLKLMRPPAAYLRRTIDRRVWPEVPVSTGFHESLGEVLHIPIQSFVLCAMPTLYNPHDLQHLQFPQFFDAATLAWREVVYPAGCHFAQTVVVGSQWIKEDVVRRYGTDPEKIRIVLEAAPTEASTPPSDADLARVKSGLDLQMPFVLYPGVTWPHKNHVRLLQAIARLRDQHGLDVGLVCPGSRYPRFAPVVERAVKELGLGDRTRFPGHVPVLDLRAYYRLACCLVVPSLYEASSLPVFEAWHDNLPVLCSNATALPEQVRDGGLLFDPTDIEAIAGAIARTVTDADFRGELQRRGRERLRAFDLGQTAKTYRALYRRAAGRPLTEEDRRLVGTQ